ncbi:hypothetical protein GCM10010307_35500 [Streptomyces vastus]|uniref:Uncharacterized protein n=1 Tax=Streptomyces vastus TaxID=285451 RepID=A0ABP6DA73_9ACTN
MADEHGEGPPEEWGGNADGGAELSGGAVALRRRGAARSVRHRAGHQPQAATPAAGCLAFGVDFGLPGAKGAAEKLEEVGDPVGRDADQVRPEHFSAPVKGVDGSVGFSYPRHQLPMKS